MKEIIPRLSQAGRKIQTKALLKASEKTLDLEAFLKKCIGENLKGEKMMELARQEGITLSYRSLKYKIDEYKEIGLQALIRKQKSDKGEMKSFSNEVLAKLQELYVTSLCMIRAYEETHKWLRNICVEFTPDKNKDNGGSFKIQRGLLYQIENNVVLMQLSAEFLPGEYVTNTGECLSIGSYASAARYLKGIKERNADELHFARYGKESYRLKRQHSIALDYSALQPNDLWSADNKRADIILIDWDWKSVFRPWLSGFLDVPTRRYTYEITRSANSESISNSFCNAVQKWGLPKEINHDLGKDYLSDRLAKMFSSLNIKVRKSISRNARAKLIESFHNILDNKLRHLPGYTGNKYQEMPEQTKLMLKQFTKAEKIFKNIHKHVFDDEFRVTLNSNLEGRIKSSKKRFLHISEFIRMLDTALNEYEETLHGGLKKDGLGAKVYDRSHTEDLIVKYSEKLNTPKGRYEYFIESGFLPVRVEPGVISIFAMNNSLRTVRISGIQFRDTHYFSPKLKSVLGKKVLIKFTESNDKFIYVFTSDEIQGIESDTMFRKTKGADIINHLDFVCMAEKRKIFGYGDEAYREQLSDQRREEKQIKETLSITKMTGFEGNIHKIHAEVEEIIEKTSKLKLKDTWED